METDQAVETVSDATSGMTTSTKVIVAGVAVAAVAAGATFIVRKIRAKKAEREMWAEATVVTPDDFVPAETR